MKKLTTFNLVCTMNWEETEEKPFINMVRQIVHCIKDRDDELNYSITWDAESRKYIFNGNTQGPQDCVQFTFENMDQFISRFVNDFKGGWNLAMYAADYASVRSCSSGTSDIPETETQSG